jgi:hypothetical protein
LAGGRAWADDSPTDRGLAEVLFREGRELMDKGQAALACPKFRESYRLDPALGTLLNLAVCQEQIGQLASAWARYGEAATLARQKGDATRQAFAEEGRRRLEGRFATLRIGLAKPLHEIRDLSFVLDNLELNRAVADTPIPVDPGKHWLVVKANGYESWSQAIEVAPGATRVDVEVPALKATSPLPVVVPAAAPGAEPAKAAEPPPPPAEPNAPGSTQRVVGLVLGASGVVGLGISLGFGAHALGKKRDRDELCPNGICTSEEGIDAHESADDAATVANIVGVAGGALLAAGVVVYFTAPHSTGVRAGSSALSFGLGSVRWSGTWD